MLDAVSALVATVAGANAASEGRGPSSGHWRLLAGGLRQSWSRYGGGGLHGQGVAVVGARAGRAMPRASVTGWVSARRGGGDSGGRGVSVGEGKSERSGGGPAGLSGPRSRLSASPHHGSQRPRGESSGGVGGAAHSSPRWRRWRHGKGSAHMPGRGSGGRQRSRRLGTGWESRASQSTKCRSVVSRCTNPAWTCHAHPHALESCLAKTAQSSMTS